MMNIRKLLMSAIFAGAVATAHAEPGASKDPAFAKIEDNPDLPRVLLIGDSISIGYTSPVREMLKGKANVHRIMENGGPTSNGVNKIEQWLSPGKWDVIHFNWGLHDIKIVAGKHQVGIEDYEENLRELVEKMKATGAALIWCSTTPVPDGKLTPLRVRGDEVKFNAVAKRIMDENGIPTDDLYALARSKLKQIQLPENVHFTEGGSKVLAEQVAQSIEAAFAAKVKQAERGGANREDVCCPGRGK